MSAPNEPAPEVPVTQKREFWVLMAYAVVLGVFGAFAGLVFMGVITFGGKWYTDSDPSWFGGHWWWVAITAAAGVAVGLLRRLTHLPDQIAGLFEDLKVGARRHQTGSRDRRRLCGVADRRGQSGTGEGSGCHRRRCRHLVGPAKGARRRGLPGEHVGRLHGHVRRTVLQHVDRCDADPGGSPPGRATVPQDPCRRRRRIELRVRHLLRHRRRCVRRCLSGAAVPVRRLATPGRDPPRAVRGARRHAAGAFMLLASRLFGG